MIMNKSKKGQTEVIVTVLLVLIGIVAVGLVSAWIISMVRDNLQGTECFNTADKLKIELGDYTYFNQSEERVYVSISRSAGDFNLTGFTIIVSGAGDSQSYNIRHGQIVDNTSKFLVYPNLTNIKVPDENGGVKTYNLTYTGSEVKKVKIVPVILVDNKEKVCDQGAFESAIPIR